MTRQIVVGIDGSAPSQDALRWAISEASHTGAALTVASAWTQPYVGELTGMVGTRLCAEARAAADDLVRTAVAEESIPAWVKVRRVTAEGDAGHVLVALSKAADLLVVGSRGGGRLGVRLGSVSEHCARHAACPVVIVRAGEAPPVEHHEPVTVASHARDFRGEGELG